MWSQTKKPSQPTDSARRPSSTSSAGSAYSPTFGTPMAKRRSSCTVGSAGRLAALPGDRVDRHGAEQNGPGDHELDVGVERQQVHSVGDRADHHRAEQRRPNVTAAAEQAGAGDHRSSDREQQY